MCTHWRIDPFSRLPTIDGHDRPQKSELPHPARASALGEGGACCFQDALFGNLRDQTPETVHISKMQDDLYKCWQAIGAALDRIQTRRVKSVTGKASITIPTRSADTPSQAPLSVPDGQSSWLAWPTNGLQYKIRALYSLRYS
jgi:hypothetical protein